MSVGFPSDLMSQLQRAKVVSVLVIDDVEKAVPIAEALVAGGIRVMELTLRTDSAIESLRRIRESVPEMLAGIGTVLHPDQVNEVVEAGAHFAVSPGLNPAVVERAVEKNLPFAPGVMTPSEIEAGLEMGCHEFKFFPAMPAGGLKMLDSIRAPYAHLGVRFIPLGGINAKNMNRWLDNPGVFAVGGSWLTPRSTIENSDWSEITRLAVEATGIANSNETEA